MCAGARGSHRGSEREKAPFRLCREPPRIDAVDTADLGKVLDLALEQLEGRLCAQVLRSKIMMRAGGVGQEGGHGREVRSASGVVEGRVTQLVGSMEEGRVDFVRRTEQLHDAVPVGRR